MSAVETASRVLEWIVIGTGPPPRGDLMRTEELSRPPRHLIEALAWATQTGAARLRLGAPPLGDHTPIGSGAILLAAALGVADLAGHAEVLLKAIPRATGPADWVARHAIAGRALVYLAANLADEFRQVSPLTAVLDRPAPGQRDHALEIIQELIGRPSGRLALIHAFSEPSKSPEIRRWRQDLMDQLRHLKRDGLEFLLDVYEACLIHHEDEAMAQIRAASIVLADPLASADSQRLEEALSIAEWWGPLAALRRNDPAALRSRHYLGYNYTLGIRLYRLAQTLRGVLV